MPHHPTTHVLTALACADDGQYSLTCGRDRTVKLANPLTGLVLYTYKGHGNDVNDAAGYNK